MSTSFRIVLSILLPVFLNANVFAVDSDRILQEDKQHVNSWNRFAEQALELHKKLIQKHPIRISQRIGGYVHQPKFFTEKSYIHAKTGKLISRVQWEEQHPENLHSIEVFIRDKQGRVIRDYIAAYLPDGRNAPIQALINLHAYNEGLHAFRQFDASSDVIYEYCEGVFQGKKRRLRLFEDDIASNDRDARELVSSPFYRSCFAGIPNRVGKYLTPQ